MFAPHFLEESRVCVVSVPHVRQQSRVCVDILRHVLEQSRVFVPRPPTIASLPLQVPTARIRTSSKSREFALLASNRRVFALPESPRAPTVASFVCHVRQQSRVFAARPPTVASSCAQVPMFDGADPHFLEELAIEMVSLPETS